MQNPFKNEIIIDGLQYCNWNRHLFEDLLNGGITAVQVTLIYWENTKETFEKINEWEKNFIKYKDIISFAQNSNDVLNSKKNNKLAILFGFQNSAPIGNDIYLLEKFFSKGVRFMQLTYNNQTFLGGGCFESHDSGLSRFGHAVVEEMNRLGMVIDLSHAGKKTCIDAINYSTKPVSFTHANPLFFHNSKRNIDDLVLKNLATKGGVIGLSLYPFHLKNNSKCKLEDFCNMIIKLVNMIGIDHVGIGSDLCKNWDDEVVMWMRNGKWTKKLDYGESKNNSISWPKQPNWFTKGSDFINIYEGLKKVGMRESEIFKILGKNWLRFYKEIFG
ncbi:MAG: hypothetical protein CFH19_00310 [Alphaproteobacteria bacterium MarineAlpha5_Bin9]|nr:MAG: hypothetical protein CFH19_00310 [Alphaproteobacteria bacterium MarineAlpha5_Bin9]|tara:strand:- start:8856 stop:9845 length:990 start_codon:yes stop_codon:yes gene_type:complete